MFSPGSHAHIYLSVKQGNDESTPDHYRRTKPIWMISVEPHKHHVPGLPHSPAEPIHVSAALDDNGAYLVNSFSAASSGGLLGNILISDSARTSPKDVQKALGDGFAVDAATRPDAQDDPEDWIRRGLHILQNQKIIEKFDVHQFMIYADAYAASRAEHQAPALIGYPKLQKDHQKKAKKHGFWISHPMASSINPRGGGGEGEDAYGGMM